MTQISMPDYDILIKTDLFSTLEEDIQAIYPHRDVFVVTDENVDRLYREKLINALPQRHLSFCIIKPGESSKSFDVYKQVIDTLIEQGIRRNHLILALGGGVVGDLTGFVASSLYRGMPYLQIPTTLLAMVDSSIGGKVGINLPQGKNLLGAFYQPKRVLIDPVFLKTLSDREYANGLAEMIKAGLIGNKHLYHYLIDHPKVTEREIEWAIQVKREVVLIDPFDHKERMLLNFGHTFGHAIEKKHLYQTYTHGEAISYGMLIALEIGVSLKRTQQSLYDEVKTLLLSRGLVREPLLDKEVYRDDLIHDKKFLSDGLRFILVHKPGTPEIITIRPEDL